MFSEEITLKPKLYRMPRSGKRGEIAFQGEASLSNSPEEVKNLSGELKGSQCGWSLVGWDCICRA